MFWGDVERITIRAHHLSWGPSRLSNSIFPPIEPFRLELGPISFGHVRFIAVQEQGDGQHIARGCLVVNMLACIALHVWFKLMPILIRSCKAAFGRIGVALIESPTINTGSTLEPPTFGATSTWGAVPALFEMECSGAIALDVAEGVVIGIGISGSVDHFPYVTGACNTVDAWRTYVADAMFGIVVNHHGNTVDTESWGDSHRPQGYGRHQC